jgi:tetratricopeptide (TPR) repeat protein
MTTLVLLPLLLAPAAEPARPVALVVTAKGDVALHRGKDRVPLRGADRLFPGDRLAAGTDADLTLLLLSGGRRERLKPGKAATVGAKGCTPADAVEPSEGQRRLTEAQEKGLLKYARDAGEGANLRVLRGDPDPRARLVRPMSGSRVLTDHPTLTWPAVPGAVDYQVQMLSGAEGKEERVLWRLTTRATVLPYPEDEAVLKPGQKYRWRVTARLKGDAERPVIEGKFFTAREEQTAALRPLRALAQSEDPVDWLTAVAAYEAAGAFDNALPLYEKLAARSPAAANYQLALAALYDRAGDKDKADAARRRAKQPDVKAE